ncbi:MAG: hypothetical protein IPK68_15195 [Bdellovibrionales bacterium]|nr:hypothetical protein [Bdellovibrionales bacterium]
MLAQPKVISQAVWLGLSEGSGSCQCIHAVQNNRWGIQPAFRRQHGENHIADRGKAFNMKTLVITGNDPIESYMKLRESLDYIRLKRAAPALGGQGVAPLR